jgi:hypothetical protein
MRLVQLHPKQRRSRHKLHQRRMLRVHPKNHERDSADIPPRGARSHHTFAKDAGRTSATPSPVPAAKREPRRHTTPDVCVVVGSDHRALRVQARFLVNHCENRTGRIEDRIDCSFLVSEFRFRTKIALPNRHAGTELTYESVT